MREVKYMRNMIGGEREEAIRNRFEAHVTNFGQRTHWEPDWESSKKLQFFGSSRFQSEL
jgi:hypothetical protein